jgi:hypothetical protein
MADELRFQLATALAHLVAPAAFQFQRIDSLESLIALLCERRIRLDTGALQALAHAEPLQFDTVALLVDRCIRPCLVDGAAPTPELALAVDALTAALRVAHPSQWLNARLSAAQLVECVDADTPLAASCARCLAALAHLHAPLVPADLFRRLVAIAAVRAAANADLRTLVASLYITYAADCDDALLLHTLGANATLAIAAAILAPPEHPFIVRARALNLLPQSFVVDADTAATAPRSPLKKQSGSRRALLADDDAAVNKEKRKKKLPAVDTNVI